MLVLSEIDSERAAIRGMRLARKAGDHARDIEAANHFAELREASQRGLAFVRAVQS